MIAGVYTTIADRMEPLPSLRTRREGSGFLWYTWDYNYTPL